MMLRGTLTLIAAGAVLAGFTATASAETRTGYVVVEDGLDVAVAEQTTALAAETSAEPVIFFLNRQGGTYRPGGEDSRRNMSSIVDEVSTIPAWNVSEAGWREVVSCLETMTARWNVRVVDQDPGDVAHYELVIAGRPDQIGMPSNYGGVAPFSSQCNVIPSAIVYTFADLFGSNYRAVCEVAAQEVAHAFGLDHEYLCEDPLSYLRGCGAKAFQDVDAPCGEYAARECACGAETQNSVRTFDARIGLAGQGNPPPVVDIMAPADGARVEPGFTVTADVTDNSHLLRVDLVIDGDIVATAEGAPYTFSAPAGLGDGTHTVEIRAVDEGRATTTTSIEVTIGDVDSDDGGMPGVAGCSAGGGSSSGLTALLLLALVGLRGRLARR